MKILSINKFYHIFGGSDRYFFDLNDLHRRAGHEVIPFSMQHPRNLPSEYSRFFVSHVNYWDHLSLMDRVRAARNVIYSFEAQKQMRSLLEEVRPDIAHLHIIAHQISPSILPVLKQRGIPIIQTLHDYKPICPSYGLVSHGKICERCKGGKFYHATLQRCNHDSIAASLVNTVEMYLHQAWNWYDLPDVYITPSEFMRQKLIEFGMPEKKLIHIPNFVNLDKYPYSEGFGDYFVYVGRLTQIKGVHTLLRAMEKVRNKHVRLLILGDGPQRPYLEQVMNNLGLENVRFLGYQNPDQLVHVLSNAMFSVLPSEVYEICPMSVLESMSMGKPVIGADIGGIPELIEDEVDGMLFSSGNVDELASRIDRMLSDDDRLHEMGKAAHHKIAMKYDAKTHYSQIGALYESLLL